MQSDKTEELIARAIAALPYRRPSAGFSARVLAGIAAEAQPAWEARLLKAAGLLVAAWGAGLAFVSAKLLYANFGELAALLIQPGGIAEALNLAAARAGLILAKLTAALPAFSGLLSAAAGGLPAWYETAAAALVCSAAIAAFSKGGRLARQAV
ncbi:MAG: hypothetical protein HY550_11605 [Elusimicrobia bacterium]|nr:hypothetical protein [Elusimicrobiota bacterium]